MANAQLNKEHFYKRVLRMQEEYLRHANSGRTTQYIYRTYIYPKFLISRTTFYSWLSIAPKKELERLYAERGQEDGTKGNL